MLDSSLLQSIPEFSKSKHNILCSELKQLYVAVTRTRQRLWFCEDTKEHCGPLFEYWKKKCVVQVQQLNDSLAHSMLASSSKQDWRSQGFKVRMPSISIPMFEFGMFFKSSVNCFLSYSKQLLNLLLKIPKVLLQILKVLIH